MSNNTFTLENTKDATHLEFRHGNLIFKNTKNKTFFFVDQERWRNWYFELKYDAVELYRPPGERKGDFLIPISYVKKFTPLVVGDVLVGELTGHEFNVVKDGLRGVEDVNNSNLLLVKSFSDRPNAGEKPVGDDVIVDFTRMDNKVCTQRAGDCRWRLATERVTDIKTWKPNHSVMLKQCQAEQEDKLKSAQRANNTYLTDMVDSASVADKPVYTQAISDAGELPPVGCECLIHLANESMASIITYQGNEVGCFIHIKSGKEYSFATNSVVFKPIQTEEDKLIAVMRDMNFSVDEVDDLLSSDKLTITLND